MNKEEIISLKDSMNKLKNKCEAIICFYTKEYKDQIKCYEKENKQLYNHLHIKIFGRNPFEEEIITVMFEDEEYVLENDGVRVSGVTYSGYDTNTSEFIVPFKWLELDKEEFEREITFTLTQEIGHSIGQWYEVQKEKSDDDLEKAKNILKLIPKDQLLNFIKELEVK